MRLNFHLNLKKKFPPNANIVAQVLQDCSVEEEQENIWNATSYANKSSCQKFKLPNCQQSTGSLPGIEIMLSSSVQLSVSWTQRSLWVPSSSGCADSTRAVCFPRTPPAASWLPVGSAATLLCRLALTAVAGSCRKLQEHRTIWACTCPAVSGHRSFYTLCTYGGWTLNSVREDNSPDEMREGIEPELVNLSSIINHW